MKNTQNTRFINLDDKQKINYIKTLFCNSDLITALESVLKDEKKDLANIKKVLDVIREPLIIEKLKKDNFLKDEKSTKLFVYSKIISILTFYGKSVILNQFFKSIDKSTLKEIAKYEYENKTDTSVSNKIFMKYCSKYKPSKTADQNFDTEVLLLTTEMEKYNEMKQNNKKNKKFFYVITFIILFLLFLLSIFFYQNIKKVKKYEGRIYPGIFINDMSLSGKKLEEAIFLIDKEKEKIENGTITVTNPNGDYKFTYKEIGIKIDSDYVAQELLNYNENLSFLKKIKMIRSNKRQKNFYLKGYFDETSIDNFVVTLEKKLNTSPRDDGLVIDDSHNVSYDKGSSGFVLNREKTKTNIESVLSAIKEETVVIAEGDVIKNNVSNSDLSNINKKISSYTTYFLNSGNRGHNITLAASKLNGKVLRPNEEFSYLKVVGPYGASNGYLPAPIYLNSELSTANGGGVCQLASTLYMAQLKAGLQTIYRVNHTFAPAYVPKGLDATVYSTTTDYKFKNQYNFPIYITSYVKGNYLTVDIWSNENALGGKTYEPYSFYKDGAYFSYLKEIQNGKVIGERYLGRSVYKTK